MKTTHAMNNDIKKEMKIMDLSMEAVEKAIGCSPAFFQMICKDAQPAATIQGIRIYVTPLLPVTLADGSEVHAVIVTESPATFNYPIWTEGNLVYPPLFSDWLKRRQELR